MVTSPLAAHPLFGYAYAHFYGPGSTVIVGMAVLVGDGLGTGVLVGVGLGTGVLVGVGLGAGVLVGAGFWVGDVAGVPFVKFCT